MAKEKEIRSQTNAMRDTLIQSEEIRKLAEIIEEMKSVEKPILYSST